MNTAGLLPYQVAPLSRLLSIVAEHGSGLDASDTGTGKSFVACGVVRELNLATVAVVPKSITTAWHRVAAHMQTSLDVVGWEKVRTGGTPFGRWKQTGKNAEFRWHPGVQLVIFDEIHRAKGQNTKNARMVRGALDQGIKVLGLSATMAESPLDMRALGYLCGFHVWTDFWNWCRRNGCRPGYWGGLELGGTPERKVEIMWGLNKRIFPAHGVRIRSGDIPEFPATQILAGLYDVPPEDARAVDEWWLEARQALEEKNFDCHMHARMAIELIKLQVMEELAKDDIAQGRHVLLYVNFRESAKRLVEIFKCPLIDGSTSAAARTCYLDEFQADKLPVMVLNTQAGGEGIGAHGKNRVSIISPPESARMLRQIFGRIQRHGGEHSVQRVVCLAHTSEELMAKRLTSKMDRLDALNDGDLVGW